MRGGRQVRHYSDVMMAARRKGTIAGLTLGTGRHNLINSNVFLHEY